MDININVIKKHIQENRLIGNYLIDILDSEAIEEKIHVMAIKAIIQAINSYSSRCDEPDIILISISIIALKDYNSNLWSHIEKKYNNMLNKYSSQKIGNTIRTILEKYKQYFGFKLNRQIDVPIIHTIIPKYYLPNFFEFIFDIYKTNFEYTLSEDIDVDFEFIYEGLSDYMIGDNDDVEIEVTKKTYKLIKTTKDIIKFKYDLTSLIELSTKIIKIIDSHYWNETSDHFLDNSFFKYGFTTWKNYQQTKEKIISDSNVNHREVVSRRISSFKLKQNSIYLYTAEINIKNKYNPHNILLSIYNGEELLYQEDNPTIDQIFGGYCIRQNSFALKNPLGKIRYEISCDGEIIYVSNDALYRNYYIFDTNGNELKNKRNHDYKETLFVYKRITDKQIQVVYTNDFYDIGTTIANPLNQYILGENIIILCSINNPGILGILVNNAFAEINNNVIPIYTKVESISIESMLALADISISINGKKSRLNEYNTIEIHNGNYNIITFNLADIKDNYYEIEFVEISTAKSIITYKFIKDRLLNFKTIYEDKYLYNINVNSSYNIYNELGEKTYTFKLDIKKYDTIDVTCHIENYSFKYNFLLDIPLYKLDNNKWIILENHLWHEHIDFYSELKIKGFDFESILLYSSNNEYLQDLDFTLSNGIYNFSVSCLKNYSDNYDSVVLKFMKQNNCMHDLYCLNKCMYDKNNSYIEFNSDSNELLIKTNYFGEGYLKILIKDCNDFLINEQWVDQVNGINIFKNFPTFRSYKIQFVEENKGLSLSKYRVEYEKWVKFYSYSDFVGKTIKINDIEYFKYNNKIDSLQRYSLYLKNTFIIFKKMIEPGKYIGQILIKENGKINYFQNIEYVKIEFVSIIENNSLWCSITYDEDDGLYLDYSKRTILDIDSSRDACDIYQYRLNL